MDSNSGTSLQPTTPANNHGGSSWLNRKYLLALIIIVLVVVAVVGLLLMHHKPARKPYQSTVKTPSIAAGQVDITASGFDPATLSVKIGQAVVWTNNDNKEHAVAADPYPTDSSLPGLNSQSMKTGSSYSYIFESPGTYTYHDDLNPSLHGTIIVR